MSSRPPIAPRGTPPPINLAHGHEVGLDSVGRVHAVVTLAQIYGLVDDVDDAQLPGDIAQAADEVLVEDDGPAAAELAVDDAGQVVDVVPEDALTRLQVVLRQDDGVVADPGWDALTVGEGARMVEVGPGGSPRRGAARA